MPHANLRGDRQALTERVLREVQLSERQILPREVLGRDDLGQALAERDDVVHSGADSANRRRRSRRRGGRRAATSDRAWAARSGLSRLIWMSQTGTMLDGTPYRASSNSVASGYTRRWPDRGRGIARRCTATTDAHQSMGRVADSRQVGERDVDDEHRQHAEPADHDPVESSWKRVALAMRPDAAREVDRAVAVAVDGALDEARPPCRTSHCSAATSRRRTGQDPRPVTAMPACRPSR